MDKGIKTLSSSDESGLLQFKMAQQIAELGSWEWDVLSGHVIWSDELFRIFRLPVQPVAPTLVEQEKLYHPEDWKLLNQHIEAAVSAGIAYELELRFQRADGEQGIAIAKGQALKNPKGKVTKLIGIVHDISRRKEAETQLEHFFTLALDLLCVADLEGNFVKVNKVWEEILGFNVKELEQRKFLEFIHPDDMAASLDAMSQLGKNERILSFENRYRHKDGSYRILEWHAQPFGNLIFATARNVTSRKKAALELQNVSNRLQLATQSAKIGIWDWDIPEDQLRWDDQMYSLYGLTPESFGGAYQSWQQGVHPDDRQRSNEDISLAVQGKKEFETEFRVVWLDHSVHHIRAFGVVLRNDSGEPIRMIGTNWDITLNKEMESGLEKSRKELEAFSYSVSHDLRAPLRGIEGWSGALMEEYANILDENGLLYLKRVRTEALRMEKLIDDLLKLSRITRSEMRPVAVDFTSLVRKISERMQLEEKQRVINFVIENNLKTFADASMLEILLTNLLNNAVKFTGKQAISRIEFGQTTAENGLQAFYIKDNGVGFDPTRATKLFGTFQRMHKQSEFPGTGIGLATVQRIINLHQGQIWVQTAVNEGATFYFTLNK